MRIVQELKRPCPVCDIMVGKQEVSVQDKRAYRHHLQREHGLKPYFIKT